MKEALGMKRIALLAALAFALSGASYAQAPVPSSASTPQAVPQPPAKPDPWQGLRFLVGSWEGKTTGGVAQAHASAGYSFRLELRDHVLARHSRSGACINQDDAECQHSDLLYIYPAPSGQGFEAFFLDNEGHVIRMSVTAPKPGSVVMLSDPALPGPQYRLSYDLLNEVMSGNFEIKLPGQPDFTSYLQWTGRHR
jgi:opacity protein-like surface antigen